VGRRYAACSGRAEHKEPTHAPTHLVYCHDDGRWLRAEIVQQIGSAPDQQ
jgi:hypothetical protein